MLNSLILTADTFIGDGVTDTIRLLVDAGLPDEDIYKLLKVLEKKVPSTTGSWFSWSYDLDLPFEDLTQTPNVFLNIEESFKKGREITIPELTEESATKNTFTSEMINKLFGEV